MTSASQLAECTGLDVYAASVCRAGGVTYFLARRGRDKLVGSVGPGRLEGRTVAELAGRGVVVGPTDHANARAVRAALPWTAPRLVGTAVSIGLGDRLGMAAPGHIRAVRGTGLAVVLAQQSIREMARTARAPEQVLDAATWGAMQEGFRDGFGADADHLQTPQDIDLTAATGFTLFTLDPGAEVQNAADAMDPPALAERLDALDFDALDTSRRELEGRYAGKTFALAGGGSVAFGGSAFARAAVKYARAVARTVRLYRHLCGAARGEFELEISVDETESPTSPAEHYFFAAELKRLGVEWVSLAPRFVGRFEKGVDYLGDVDAFRRSFAAHAAVMRTLGPYKISIHSGSDKFSIYGIAAELAGGRVHLKTAGTSYLEALRAVGRLSPGLFREILDFARGRYEADRATYHVSADAARVPRAASDAQLPGLLDDFHVRQVLHVTFGSVLTAEGGERFGRRIRVVLAENEEVHYAAVADHLRRHIEPFV